MARWDLLSLVSFDRLSIWISFKISCVIESLLKVGLWLSLVLLESMVLRVFSFKTGEIRPSLIVCRL